MILKSRLDGQIKCYCEGDVLACKRLLNQYRIQCTVDGTTIGISTEIKVTPFFNKDGFRDMLIKSAKRHGDITLNVGEITEEKEKDENAVKLLRQGRKAPWEEA